MNETKPPQTSAQAPETQTGTKIDQLPPQPAQTGPSAAPMKTSPSKRKSPVAKKPPLRRGINKFTALQTCIDEGFNPYLVLIEIASNKREKGATRKDAAGMLIGRIEPELLPVKGEEPKAPPTGNSGPAQSATAPVMKLVDTKI